MATLTQVLISLPPDCSPEEADLLDGLLALHASAGWEEPDQADGGLCRLAHCQTPESARALARVFAVRLPRATLRLDAVEERNWLEAWKEFFTPVEGGSHFLVLAPWMREELAQTTRLPVIIEPKTAFGTGHHASTALCLECISRLWSEGALTRDMRFLDLGTGSGILGLALARLGLAGEGLDIDPIAVDNALENRHINQIPPESFTVREGGPEQARGGYDLVVANILAGPLRDMAPDLARLSGRPGVRPRLVLSGILHSQAGDVMAAYQAEGYDQARVERREEWVALIF